MKINWQNYAIARRAADKGCTAKTALGMARWVAKHAAKLGSSMAYGWEAMQDCRSQAYERGSRLLRNVDISARRWTECVLVVDSISVQAEEAARNAHPNRRNWRSAKPVKARLDITPFGVIAHDMGRYSSKCTYTKYQYTPTYQSSIRVWRSGQTADVWALNKMVRRIIAPAGLRFSIDDEGARVVAADGTGYHPTASEWMSTKFAAVIRAALKNKRQAVRKAALATRESARVAKIRDRQMASCRVTLADSRRAGNCVEGSLAFAERRMGLSRAEILAGGHLIHVLGASLLATGDARARRAVEAAWQRETMVAI